MTVLIDFRYERVDNGAEALHLVVYVSFSESCNLTQQQILIAKYQPGLREVELIK